MAQSNGIKGFTSTASQQLQNLQRGVTPAAAQVPAVADQAKVLRSFTTGFENPAGRPLVNLTGEGAPQRKALTSSESGGPEVVVGGDNVKVQGERGPGKASIKVVHDVDVSDPYKDANGQDRATLSIDAEIEFELGVEGGGNVQVGLGYKQGVRQSYDVIASPEQIAQMQESGVYPNPYDPSTIPVGATVITTSEGFHGTEVSAGYGPVELVLGQERGEGMAFSATRLDEDTVQVTYGPTSYVEQSAKLGVSAFGVAGVELGTTNSVHTGHSVRANFDMSTEEGRAAYDEFLQTGEAPAENPPHVTDVVTIDTATGESVSSIGAHVDGWSFESTGNEYSSSVTVEDHGEYKNETIVYSHNDKSVIASSQYDAEGNRIGGPGYQLRFQDVDSGSIDLYEYQRSGQMPSVEGSPDVILSMTGEDLMNVNQMALTYVGNHQDPPMTAAEVDAALDAGEPLDPISGPNAGIIMAIANADTPEQVAEALVRSVDSPEGTLEMLKMLSETTGISLTVPIETV